MTFSVISPQCFKMWNHWEGLYLSGKSPVFSLAALQRVDAKIRLAGGGAERPRPQYELPQRQRSQRNLRWPEESHQPSENSQVNL